MSVNTGIEWTDATWSPLRVRVKQDAAEIARAKGYTSLIRIGEKMAGRVGHHCEHVSDGCKHCYSGTWQARCLKVNGTGLPFDRRSRDLIDAEVDEKALLLPLKWAKGRLIFVENQSDLFGEWYTDEMIDRVIAVGALCPQHTLQVLTKRMDRMLKWATRCGSPIVTGALVSGWAAVQLRRWGMISSDEWARNDWTDRLPWLHPSGPCMMFPLPNVHLGASVEDQATADARISILLRTPAARRFISYEPALGPLDLSDYIGHHLGCNGLDGADYGSCQCGSKGKLDWVIAGGESGPGARPFDIAWARQIIEQCKEAGVPCFVKQFGARPFDSGFEGALKLNNRKGGDMAEWPEDLRVREFPQKR